MKKVLFFLIILFFINNVSGVINIPNNNITDEIIYSNNTNIDNQYLLDITDNLMYIQLNYDLKTYPFNTVYTFKDSKNNTLKIFYSYIINNGLIFDDTITNISLSINNILSETTYSYKDTRLKIPFVTEKSNEKIIFNGNKIYVESGISLFRRAIFEQERSYYINNIIIPNSSNIIKTSITIQYRDNGISVIENDIQNNYDSLNPVFKLLFIILKIGIKIIQIVSAGYLIDNVDSLNYQNYILEPLTFLDIMISTVLFFIHFVILMGVLWTFTLISMLIFIFSMITTKDIYSGITSFFNNEYIFMDKVIIKPVVWIYQNLVLQIIAKIRGSS